MLLDDGLDAALKELIEQWNIAERRIKKAEQVRANEVVSSAIFELRYAGRKMVDAFRLVYENNWRNDDKTRERIHAYIADATEDCVKAKHDAIDAMLDFVTSWFSDTERTLGLDQVNKFFPDYLEITARISDLQDRITDSRGDRLRLRDSIYNEIEDDGYNSILDLYTRMRLSNDRISSVVSKERWQGRRSGFALWASVAIGLGALIIAIIALHHGP